MESTMPPMIRTTEEAQARLQELIARNGGPSRALLKAQKLGTIPSDAVPYRCQEEYAATQRAKAADSAEAGARGVPITPEWSGMPAVMPTELHLLDSGWTVPAPRQDDLFPMTSGAKGSAQLSLLDTAPRAR